MSVRQAVNQCLRGRHGGRMCCRWLFFCSPLIQKELLGASVRLLRGFAAGVCPFCSIVSVGLLRGLAAGVRSFCTTRVMSRRSSD
ncbi:hypothetical protein E2C01_090240 [Portunus trituberculatus]|uniref:Uncharacterized protein n=1 Tax=Portunus trituberculatus TaxID=210409 RepID=A0A5B7JLB1_PORTR|nr:hypothetical protein [Portunus trituberculatus]